MSIPDFLDTPPRTGKPRRSGLTHVLDKAMPLPVLAAYLDQCGDMIDIVKIGWGLSYLDRHVAARAETCRQHRVMLCTGGTLVEIAAHQHRVEEFRDWALAQRIEAVEVSNGLGLLSRDAKHELIARFADDFVVYAETGLKDRDSRADADEWAREMADDLAAGASSVIAEGRESGTVGLYNQDGTIRAALVDAVASRIDSSQIIFEAPLKSQQLWLIERFGPDVSLGNVELTEVSSVQSLRLGLRADTAVGYVRTVAP